MTPNPERRKILVIDDSDAIHTDFRKTLERRASTQRLAVAASALFGESRSSKEFGPSFDVESALQGKEGLEKVQQSIRENRPYALAFVDMRMPPGWDGVETIQHLWEADPDLQVVICTAYTDYSWDQIIEKLGSTDRFLILKKPFDPMEVCQLATALTEKWKLKRQATLKLDELEAMVHDRTTELRRIALTDKLTGLPNRACLNELLVKAAEKAGDPASQFALHFIDFDRFKIINDSLGHNVGDLLLITIADRLRNLFHLSDATDLATAPFVAARLGGDEFVILQRKVHSTDDAVACAEKLLATLNTTYQLDQNEAHSTASIGAAISTPYAHRPEEILRDADSAMYHAKSLGKARYAIFSPDMHRNNVAKLTLECDLRRALLKEQFVLAYQPIVSLVDASLLGFEALIRWNHPERGIIPPNDFISLAEETGLILPIGQWVIRECTKQLALWTTQFPAANLTMSFNCSRTQLNDPQLTSTIAESLQQHHLDPARLNLEITESIVMSNPDHSRAILTQLRSLGIKIHMDDFGTGYSSLNCLHSLPLDTLKIDRSFIHNVSLRRDYAAIVDAIIFLAHNLQMTVIAEGVETADHAALLCSLDCDDAQGYFFSKPLFAADAEAFIVTTQRPRAESISKTTNTSQTSNN